MLYFKHQVKQFVILMQGRTGSHYLVQALNSHPAVRAVGEGLAPLRLAGWEAQARWLRDFLTPPWVGRNRALGFKTKLVDVLEPAQFAGVLKQIEAIIVRLERRNHVKQAVSWINAQRLHAETGAWHIYDEKDRLPPPTIDVEDFRGRLAWLAEEKQQLETFVDSLHLTTLPLYYEDMMADQQATFDRLFALLDVPPRPVQGRTRKVTRDDLRQAIANFDELRAAFAGTPYEWMFDA